jgi:hypothetical protein
VKAIVATRYGSPEVLQFQEVEKHLLAVQLELRFSLLVPSWLTELANKVLYLIYAYANFSH